MNTKYYIFNYILRKLGFFIINAWCLENNGGSETFAFSRTYDLESVHARDRPSDYLTRRHINRRRRNDSIIYERYVIARDAMSLLSPSLRYRCCP